MILLETKDLSLGYDGKEVLKGINLHVHDDDYLCIIGNNGSGKSTLIKGLLGLIPPLKGEIKLSPTLSRKEIGYLPQITTSQQNFPASVYEIVSSGILNTKKIFPLFTKEEKKRIQNAMQKLQIEHLKNKSYKELSGGQQQKVLLARSLCATQRILILDEPITGLDEDSRNEVYQIVNRLHKEEHIAIIMITHNINEVAFYATRTMLVENQCIINQKSETSLRGKLYDK